MQDEQDRPDQAVDLDEAGYTKPGRRDRVFIGTGQREEGPLSADEGGLTGCFATDRITVDGRKVGYMERGEPLYDADSGWTFTAGDEDGAYLENAGNVGLFHLNYIAQLDPDILPFLDAPAGSAFERDEKGEFRAADRDI